MKSCRNSSSAGEPYAIRSTRPPGFVTRTISRNTRGWSGTSITPNWDPVTSKEPSGRSSAWQSITRPSALISPSSRTRAANISIIAGTSPWRAPLRRGAPPAGSGRPSPPRRREAAPRPRARPCGVPRSPAPPLEGRRTVEALGMHPTPPAARHAPRSRIVHPVSSSVASSSCAKPFPDDRRAEGRFRPRTKHPFPQRPGVGYFSRVRPRRTGRTAWMLPPPKRRESVATCAGRVSSTVGGTKRRGRVKRGIGRPRVSVGAAAASHASRLRMRFAPSASPFAAGNRATRRS